MVIPVHDVNPVRRTPVVTYALIAANILVFLFMPGLSGSVAGDSSLAQLCQLQAFLRPLRGGPTGADPPSDCRGSSPPATSA